jgi:hypothetical protein
MPHLRKGGKYVFGWSQVREDGGILLPDEALQEYRLDAVEKVILMSGSKTSGGFGITTKALLEQSPLSGILFTNPNLANYEIGEGKTVRFKGRAICWLNISASGLIILSPEAMRTYRVNLGDYLLSIRSSNIAIGMVLKGPLIEVAKRYPEIKVFD